jgi:large repetitive protein
MPSQGPRNPGTGANDAAVGTQAWSNPSNVLTEDGTSATVSLGTLSGASSHYLKATNFGFGIPAGAVIDGIVVEIKRAEGAAGSDTIRDQAVRIVKADGSIGTTNKAATSTDWPTTLAYAAYGSASDKWGETWTAADINDADFGAVLQATCSGSFEDARVDHIRITVHYTDPTGSAMAATQVI